MAASPPEQALRVPSLGLGLTDLTPDVREQLNPQDDQRGALVERVIPDKAASAAGIQPGDVIVGVDQTPVKSARQANQAIAQAGRSGRKSVLLLVDRGDAQGIRRSALRRRLNREAQQLATSVASLLGPQNSCCPPGYLREHWLRSISTRSNGLS